MTISAVPFALQNVAINADVVREAVSSLVPNGGGTVQSGDFPVTQLSTPAMGVQVGIGRAWIPGTNLANLSGMSYSKQGMYYVLNDGAYTATVNTSDPTNPRIDVVYIVVPDTAYAGSSNTPVIAVSPGNPTPGASYPTNAPTLPANSIALAWIYVAANATQILNGNITTILEPVLTPLPFMHSEWTFNSTGIPSATVWGMGTPSLDASNTTDTGFITSPGTDRLTFRDAGVYAVSVFGSWGTATTARGFSQFTDGSGNAVARASAAVNENTLSVALGNFKVAAGQNMTISTYLTCSGTTSWTGRVRITRVR